MLNLVKQVIGNANPLVTLVAFHSTFNLIGIALFLPFFYPNTPAFWRGVF
ncbi:MAG: hypothetical protein IPN33_19010 [Saprospiraceae bacterium]|nr:hypothetical protein [Saprospiraceae bacterium]